MRISTLQQYQVSINRMQDSQNKIGDLQRQISTGIKYDQPSDAPGIAAESIRMERDVSAMERYNYNIEIAETRLGLQDEMLENMKNRYDRLSGLAASVDAGENDDNLITTAAEVRQIVAALAGGMNVRDAQGEYIFAVARGILSPTCSAPLGAGSIRATTASERSR